MRARHIFRRLDTRIRTSVRTAIVRTTATSISKRFARPVDSWTLLSARTSDIGLWVKFDMRSQLPPRMVYDLNWSEFTEVPPEGWAHPTVRDMFVLGIPASATEQYARMLGAVRLFEESGDVAALRTAYWCRSERDVERYFEILSASFESIERQGYLSQRELLARTGAIGRGTMVRGLRDEIEILIDHEGSLVFSGRFANHRFAMVKLLGLERVPVFLGGVSEVWLSTRVDLHRMKLSDCVARIIDVHGGLGPYETSLGGV